MNKTIKLFLTFLIGWGILLISKLGQVNDGSSIFNEQFMNLLATDPEMKNVFLAAPVGSLGPKGTAREHYTYYDRLFFISMQYGRDAKSLLEVGCANDPFAKYLSWIDDKTCVAPYKVRYEGKNEKNVTAPEVAFVQADFMKFQEPKKYDLLLCSQVVEHVKEPGAFVKKLIETAKTSIISVPYMWRENFKTSKNNHISGSISLETMKQWSAPYEPTYHLIVRENAGSHGARIIVIFENE